MNPVLVVRSIDDRNMNSMNRMDRMNRELKAILKDNPFTEELVRSWRRKLVAIRKAHLRDSTLPAYDLDNPIYRFVLPDDPKYNTTIIRTEYIPQPFIGHPSAPIWILNQNPSFFKSDLFAMFDVSSAGVKMASGSVEMWRKATKKKRDRVVHCCCDITGHQDEDARLKNRQELMLKQLRLDEPVFFALEDVFDIGCDKVKEAGEGFPSKMSIYSWWRSFAIGSTQANFPFHCYVDCDALAKNIFVMEAFPYRSIHWSDAENLWQNCRYYAFWKLMVEYAFRNKKHIIIRSGRNASLAANVKAIVGKGRFKSAMWFASERHPTLSYNNISTFDGVVVPRSLIVPV